MWTALALLAALLVVAIFVNRTLRGPPFEGRKFGCGAGYQPRRGGKQTKDTTPRRGKN